VCVKVWMAWTECLINCMDYYFMFRFTSLFVEFVHRMEGKMDKLGIYNQGNFPLLLPVFLFFVVVMMNCFITYITRACL
jgi:hypothetical protein